MSPTQIWRIARRDAWDVMRSGTFVALFLGPLLLTLLLTVLVGLATLMLTAVKVAAPDTAPLGRDTIGVVLEAGGPPASQALAAELLDALRQPAVVSPEEARLVKRFVSFVRDASLSSAGPSGEKIPTRSSSAQAEGTPERIKVELLSGQSWEQARAAVPGRFDAALRLRPLPDGRLSWEVAYDNRLMFSRLMNRQLEGRLEDFNQRARASTLKAAGFLVQVADRPSPGYDLWLVQALLLISALGLGFMYYSVGAQGVAAVLAGERESRTLEVLLSLPVTRRDILYGKVLGMVLTTTLPALFWAGLLGWAVERVLSVQVPWLPLAGLLVAVQVASTALGCAVSASSPDTLTARNRLGIANLGLFVLGGAVLALPPSVWPGGLHPLIGLLRVATGGPESQLSLLLMVLVLLGAAVAILEAGMIFFRRA